LVEAKGNFLAGTSGELIIRIQIPRGVTLVPLKIRKVEQPAERRPLCVVQHSMQQPCTGDQE